MLSREQLASYIDHTQLKPIATHDDIAKLCDEAIEYGFHSVCVNSCYVKHAADKLLKTPVKVCATIGFPLGAMSKEAKAFEAAEAVKAGATEIDMVANLGLFKSGDYFGVTEDINAVVSAVKQLNSEAIVKVILETCYLDSYEKVSICKLAMDGGADFVKTSTGFGPGGATVEDVILLKKMVGDSLGVKAAGGIRDLETAVAMIEAGATRIGASAGVRLINEIKEKE